MTNKLRFYFNYILWFVLLTTLVSCQHTMYIPRSTNIPQLDSNKNSDLNVRPGLFCSEIQHNHLLMDRIVLQNNFAFRMISDGFSGVGELGLGYYLDKDYDKLVLAGTGYSYQNYTYYLSDWTGYHDGIDFEVYIPKQINYFLQFSKVIKKTSDSNHSFTVYERTDFSYIDNIQMRYVSMFNGSIPFFVQDLGASIYLKPIRLNLNFGFRFSYTSMDILQFDSPLTQNMVYYRISARF